VLDLPASEELARTYGQLVTTSPVLERAIRQARLDIDVRELKRRIDVSVGTASQLIEIRASAPDAEQAEALSAILADTFIRSRASDRLHGARVTVAEPAQPAEEIAPNLLAAGVLAGIFGVALAFGVVLARDHFLDPIIDTGQLEEATGVRVIATIPPFRQPLLARARAGASRASPAELPGVTTNERGFEPYQLLRTVVDSTLGQSPRTLVLVSAPVYGAGVSTTAANLALAFSQLGRRILVVDCNLGAPSQHERFDVSNDTGLAELLERGRASQDSVRVAPSGVAIVPAGMPSRSPADLLASSPTKAVLKSLATQFDIVLLDAPPAGFADTRILTRLADRALIVVDPRMSSVSSVREAVDLVESGKILGIVLNRARGADRWSRQPRASEAPATERAESSRHPSPSHTIPAAPPRTANVPAE
jgi:capsular exopolysaccharide synthesis family protein